MSIPLVSHLLDSLKIALALLGRDGDVVHGLPVEVRDLNGEEPSRRD